MLSDKPVKSSQGEWSVRKSLGYIQRKRWLIDNDSHRFLQKSFTNAKNIDARSNIFWLHSGDAANPLYSCRNFTAHDVVDPHIFRL